MLADVHPVQIGKILLDGLTDGAEVKAANFPVGVMPRGPRPAFVKVPDSPRCDTV